MRSNIGIHECFNNNFNVDEMVLKISANIFNIRFVENDTLIILDEIQDCPNARSSLKYWDLDGRYDVIATGSFLGVKGFRNVYSRGIPVGYEEFMIMHPLSFKEFLVNIGIDNKIIDIVSNSINNQIKIDDAIHSSIRNLYYQYIITGGMPEVVSEFINNHDLNNVRRIQRSIIKSISDDFGRYVDSNGNNRINETLKLRANACLNSLPFQLSKEYKKFQYSLVNCKGHSPEKADGLEYLVDLGLVIKSNNVRELSYPIKAQAIDSEFKIYVADIGLLTSMFDELSLSNILNGDLSSYKGAIAENVIACSFETNNKKTYFYRNSTGSPELDFVYDNNGQVTVIECKSTSRRATSMKYVIANKKKYGEHRFIKISDTNIGHGDGFDTYPIYAMEFLLNNNY